MSTVQNSAPTPPVDPFQQMTPDEFEANRGKLLAIEKSSGRVLASEGVSPSDAAGDPIDRIRSSLATQHSEQDWYLLPGPPAIGSNARDGG